jgi:uncharacterized OB-fold protein
MANEYKLPLPIRQPESDFYWEKAKAHELWLRKCTDCENVYFYPRDICPSCYSNNVEWIQASGKATLHAYSIAERGPTPVFRDAVPYVAALVDLDEGPRMPTNLVGVEMDEDHIKVGMALEATFDDITDEVTLPKFKPMS